MAKIHYLEENLKNMIAAGEVVERPSGIIKELVDNAIDANATRIEVRIKAGGLEEIEVIDDGEGMDFDDALLCFKRHATSKISQESDLFKILSLGFRGEALPSIASVSKEIALGTVDLQLKLKNNKNQLVSNQLIKLEVKTKYQHHKKTFISTIDGSVQYYSVAPSTDKNSET